MEVEKDLYYNNTRCDALVNIPHIRSDDNINTISYCRESVSHGYLNLYEKNINLGILLHLTSFLNKHKALLLLFCQSALNFSFYIFVFFASDLDINIFKMFAIKQA